MTREERFRKLRQWAPHAGACAILVALLAYDRPTLEWIQELHSPTVDALTQLAAQLHGIALPLLVGMSLVSWGIAKARARIRKAGAALLIAVILSAAAATVLKSAFERPGPGGFKSGSGESRLIRRFGRFPSSHAAELFSGATVMAEFLPSTASPSFLIATLVCHERLYRNTHFPSDVFAGAWLGIVLARFTLSRLYPA